MPLFWRRAQGLCQNYEGSQAKGNLPGFRGEKGAGCPYKITQIQMPENVELFISQHVFLSIYLQAAGLVAHVDKHTFAHVPVCRDSASHGKLPALDVVYARFRAFVLPCELALER